MSKSYIYKMTVDNGGAPCVYNGLLSFAICKPAIRASADIQDVILGFAANHLYEDNCLVYAARITARLDGREYFSNPKYSSRPDCVYTWDGCRFKWRNGSAYHSPSHLTHDLGEQPLYERAHVLLSEGVGNFRYFRNACTIVYKNEYPRLRTLVEHLGQGHRVNFGSDLQRELKRLQERLWKAPWEYRQTEIKSTSCSEEICAGEDDFFAVEC